MVVYEVDKNLPTLPDKSSIAKQLVRLDFSGNNIQSIWVYFPL